MSYEFLQIGSVFQSLLLYKFYPCSLTEEELLRTRQAMVRQQSRDHQGSSHGSDFYPAQYRTSSKQSAQHMPTSAPREKYDPKGGGVKNQQHPPRTFDPSKYSGENERSHNSSPDMGSWSVSASIHSQSSSFYDYSNSCNPTSASSNTNNNHFQGPQTTGLINQDPAGSNRLTERSSADDPPSALQAVAPSRPNRPPHHPGSLSSDQSESDFSLNSTRKALDFEGDSKLRSLHDKQGGHQVGES